MYKNDLGAKVFALLKKIADLISKYLPVVSVRWAELFNPLPLLWAQFNKFSSHELLVLF